MGTVAKHADVRIAPLEELTQTYLEAKAAYEDARSQIKKLIKPGEKITLPNGVKISLTHSRLSSTKSLSAEKVKERYPEVYAKCLVYKDTPSRLTITKPKTDVAGDN